MMQVVDQEKSERGEQRRKSPEGRLMHCCCLCGVLGVWGANWSWYGSEKTLDDGERAAKFCGAACRESAGANAENVTTEMLDVAVEKEMRPPRIHWRPATEHEKYTAARRTQEGRDNG